MAGKAADRVSLGPTQGVARPGCGWCGRSTVGLLLMLLLCAGAKESRAQDGSALLHKMMDAYQHLSTYEMHSNVDLTLSANGRVMKSQSITNILQCKRPNKLALVVYNSGPTMTVYDALPNHYFSGSTAPNMATILNLLALRAHVTADLDPLYFLCLNRLPSTLTGLKAAGSTTINGRPSLIVTGTVRSAQTPVQKNNGTVTTNILHMTWYIDQQTYLLNKIEAHSDAMNTPVTTMVKGKPVKATFNVVMNLRHSISSFHVNTPIDDSAFVFKAPVGAVGQKSGDPVKGVR
jgi:hypothetical protein